MKASRPKQHARSTCAAFNLYLSTAWCKVQEISSFLEELNLGDDPRAIGHQGEGEEKLSKRSLGPVRGQLANAVTSQTTPDLA